MPLHLQQYSEAVRGILVVIGYQYPSMSRRRRCRRRRRFLSDDGTQDTMRQPNNEFTSLSRTGTCGPDRTPMQLHQALSERKSNAKAAI
jgi:hypothetical protein